MSKSAQAIESAALLLPRKERARLAERLIASLEEQDPEVEAAWAAEIRRRMDEWEAGLVDEIPWDEARRQIEQRLSRPSSGSTPSPSPARDPSAAHATCV
jgi:putative addiction module component (TIGR02574 family)